MLLQLNLQKFADGDELDIDTMLEEFEKEYSEEPTEPTEPNEPTEPTEPVEPSEPTEPTEPTEPNPNDSDEHKRNQAFAELRKQAEENKKYAEFIERLAKEGGVTPDDLLKRYEEQQIQQEAEKQKVPVEFFKESRETAERLTKLEENMRAERMQVQIDSTISKYGATDDDIREAFGYMMESGVDPRTADNVDFEKFYRAAHLDKIIQKEVETARQKDLEDKKKRQENASIGNGNSVSPSNGNDWSDEEFEAELERLNLRL